MGNSKGSNVHSEVHCFKADEICRANSSYCCVRNILVLGGERREENQAINVSIITQQRDAKNVYREDQASFLCIFLEGSISPNVHSGGEESG